jgi:hypothetical protein
MLSTDRRYRSRIPLEMYLNTYVNDRAQRAFTLNLSPSGLFLNTLPRTVVAPHTAVGLEFTLPGMEETIWAAGEICYDKTNDEYFLGRGVRFTAMAGLHARMIHAFCRRLHRDKWRLPRGDA